MRSYPHSFSFPSLTKPPMEIGAFTSHVWHNSIEACYRRELRYRSQACHTYVNWYKGATWSLRMKVWSYWHTTSGMVGHNLPSNHHFQWNIDRHRKAPDPCLTRSLVKDNGIIVDGRHIRWVPAFCLKSTQSHRTDCWLSYIGYTLNRSLAGSSVVDVFVNVPVHKEHHR